MRTIIVSFLFLVLIACFRPNHPGFQSIYPIEQISSMVDMFDSSGHFQSRELTEYYIVYGNISDSLFVKKLLVEYAIGHFDQALIKLPILYRMKFYQFSGSVTYSTSMFVKNRVGYTDQNCFGVVTYNPQGASSYSFFA